MIDVLFEQHIVQNTGLAAEAIWEAVHAAHEANGRAEGVSLPLAFLVLPLTFHERTAKILASKTQPGALYKALADEREITVGFSNACNRCRSALSKRYLLLSSLDCWGLTKILSDN
jgi:hypothetical protein